MPEDGELKKPEDGELVQLFIYDLSAGLARALSPSLLGLQIDGVWHTSVVVAGREHYFGGGINVAPAGTTPFGRPVDVVDLGYTSVPQDVREALLVDLSERYTPESYSLLSNNCNNFSDELASILTGNFIPPHITGLPAAVLATPFGTMLRPMLAGLEAQMRGMRQHAITHQAHAPLAAPPPLQPTAIPSPPEQLVHAEAALGAAEQAVTGEAGSEQVEPLAPAVAAAEHELEVALAESMMAELDVKEARGYTTRELSPEEVARLETEAAVRHEFDRLVASGATDIRQAEEAAVERVAAAQRRAAAAEARRAAGS